MINMKTHKLKSPRVGILFYNGTNETKMIYGVANVT